MSGIRVLVCTTSLAVRSEASRGLYLPNKNISQMKKQEIKMKITSTRPGQLSARSLAGLFPGFGMVAWHGRMHLQ